MSDIALIDQITKEISQSKIYKPLNPEIIRRVVIEFLPKYPQKQLVKEVKNKLHQIWGAFFDQGVNFDKILTNFKQLEDRHDKLIFLTQTLKLHSSTAERQKILPDFWDKIFTVCPNVKSITEHGCGLNPICLLVSNHSDKISYTGYDIDNFEINFLQKIFSVFNPNLDFKAFYGDLLTQIVNPSQNDPSNQILSQTSNQPTTPLADMVLLLKLLPTIEQQQKGISLQILNQLPNKWIVVSFPILSLGNKQKNMADFYTKWFEDLLTKVKYKTQVTRLDFKNELVFVIEKENAV